MRNLPPPFDVFVCHADCGTSGAKVVEDRNLWFWEQAAAARDRQVLKIVPNPPPSDQWTFWVWLVNFLTRLTPNDLRAVVRAARGGGDVWIDHGSLGLVVVLLRLLRVRGQIVFYHHNDEARYEADLRRSEGHRGWRLTARSAMARLRQRLGARAAHRNLYISQIEHDRLHRSGPSFVLPPTWPEHSAFQGESEAFILMIGSRFFANVHGFGWYIDTVAPRCAAPTIIVGNGIDHVFQSGGTVRVLGFVPDLLPLYGRARLVAVPIFLGAGTKIKLAEALHMGCQAIATPQAAEGIDRVQDFVATGQLIIADADQFATRLADELSQRPKAPRFAPNSFSHDRYLIEFLRFCGSGLPLDPHR